MVAYNWRELNEIVDKRWDSHWLLWGPDRLGAWQRWKWWGYGEFAFVMGRVVGRAERADHDRPESLVQRLGPSPCKRHPKFGVEEGAVPRRVSEGLINTSGLQFARDRYHLCHHHPA